jgi:hypothetical protein
MDRETMSRWAFGGLIGQTGNAPRQCECDRFKHEDTPCTFPAEDHGDVISSPALCTACLFYCWADE